MKRCILISAVLFLVVLPRENVGDEQSDSARKPATTNKVYGEWLIRVKPDKGAEYNQLIDVLQISRFPRLRKAQVEQHLVAAVGI